jgi:tRNA nucleotidyltransferase (CCA-adding enzyme)
MAPIFDQAVKIAEAVRAAGGRALIVGGYVRDMAFENVWIDNAPESKDLDIEVYKLAIDQLKAALLPFGEVEMVGKAFGVFKVAGCDISLPRKDSKVGPGHTGFEISVDPNMSFSEAASRRDFTINSMGLDPLEGTTFDPYNGVDDIMNKVLRATDPKTFVEDPLRVMRAAQFISRFDLTPTESLKKLCANIVDTMKELPSERLWEEWNKLLLKGNKPSKGIYFLRDVGVLQLLFPEVAALTGVQQDPEWHPEGDVFIHTNMAVDAAAEMRTGDLAHDMLLMYGTLCHDFGKTWTTKFEDGRWRARGHEDAGVEPSMTFLGRLRAPADLMRQVSVVVAHHLAPAHFMNPKMHATPRAYRTLARKLADAGTTVEMLYKVAKADHFGRTTPDAIAREFTAGDAFLKKASEIQVVNKPEPDVVMGRHLIARGMTPGRQFGLILGQCRDYQYETGSKDPEEILKVVLDGKATAEATQSMP